MNLSPAELAEAFLSAIPVSVIAFDATDRIVTITSTLRHVLQRDTDALVGLTLDEFCTQFHVEPPSPIVATNVFHLPHLITMRRIPATPRLARQGIAYLLVATPDDGYAVMTMVSIQSTSLMSPLSFLNGAIDILRRGVIGALTPEQDEVLSAMHRYGQQMVRCNHQYFTYYNLFYKTFTVERAELDVLRIITHVIERLTPTYAEKQIHVMLDPGEPPPPLWSDPELVTGIVTQLVENAFQNTPRAGAITIHIAVTSNTSVTITITNTGEAIPDHNRTMLFHTPTNSTTHGAGLGLLICAALAYRIQAQLSYRYLQEVGNQFHLSLPWEKERNTSDKT